MGCGGYGDGGRSGGVLSGMSTVSKEDNLGVSSEVSSCPDDSELELGLGLSLGSGGCGAKSKAASWGQYARILTAMDFPSGISASSSSSSSTSATAPNNASCGTKRAADSVSPPRSGVSQVVGWPPLRTYRMNSLVCQTKSPTIEEFSSTFEKSKSKSIVASKTNGDSKNNNDPKGKRLSKTSLFVKVNMDGILIGRKVDLSAHTSYEGLVHTLDAMFSTPNTAISSKCSNIDEKGVLTETAQYPRLFHGSSQYVLTYEDKEGDWMLVGDVPWEMFLSSVKRLRIMRTSDAHRLSPAFLERNGRQRTKPI